MILDTFKMTEGHIFLKELHIERSLEACVSLNSGTSSSDLISIYEKIERRYKNAILSVIIDPFDLSNWHSHEKKIEFLAEPILLSLSFDAHLIPKSTFKWADRKPWNNLVNQKPPTAQDTLLVHPDGLIRETSRFNVFIFDRHRNCYLTPSLESGCVNGVLRRWLLQRGLEKGPVVSSTVFISQLQDTDRYELFVGNSVRGLLRAQMI